VEPEGRGREGAVGWEAEAVDRLGLVVTIILGVPMTPFEDVPAPILTGCPATVFMGTEFDDATPILMRAGTEAAPVAPLFEDEDIVYKFSKESH